MRFKTPEAAVHALCSAEACAAIHSAVIVCAHPDDEVIGAGSRLKYLRAGLAIIYVTDGSPKNLADANANGLATREEYAALRKTELADALALAGITLDHTIHLGFTDQEVSLAMVDLVRQLASILRPLQPSIVLTHPYEGGHPDHDATSFAVQMACRFLGELSGYAPHLAEMTSYHNRGGNITTGEFLPKHDVAVQTVRLTSDEKLLKCEMLRSFKSQRETLRYFQTELERFRVAPSYVFTLPPHPGPLFYELYDWGMTGAHWRELVRDALNRLDVPVPVCPSRS